MLRVAALVLVALTALTAGAPGARAEDDSEVERVSTPDGPLDLVARIRNASGADKTHLAVDVSIVEFITLQRLPAEDRQRLFGLVPGCQTRMTAASTASGRADRVLVVIACAP
jgi:hypothetical protein